MLGFPRSSRSSKWSFYLYSTLLISCILFLCVTKIKYLWFLLCTWAITVWLSQCINTTRISISKKRIALNNSLNYFASLLATSSATNLVTIVYVKATGPWHSINTNPFVAFISSLCEIQSTSLYSSRSIGYFL